LISCFVGEKADSSLDVFSEKFMKLVLTVIKEKRDRFTLKTLVQVIWACARIDFSNSHFEMIPLL
jgi:hypothetical protein